MAHANPQAGASGRGQGALLSGLIGAVLGAGLMFVIMLNFGYRLRPAQMQPPPGGGMGPMMGAAAGGGGESPANAQSKRNLTVLVNEMEVLSREDLRLEFDDSQKAQVRESLSALAEAESLTADEAQTYLEKLQSMLTESQRAKLELVTVPPPQPPASDEGPLGTAPEPEDHNPFRDAHNEQPLQQLLDRLDASAST